MKTKLSPRFWLALTLFSLIGQIAWVVENMYLNVFIYKMFNATAGDISAMVAASAVAATLTTVFIGALSDKIGKRKLFVCGGYIMWGISIFGFSLLRLELIDALFPMAVSAASVGVTLVIVLDCLMTFFGSSANDAAFNAWLTDMTDSSNRGAAEGINAMMPLVAILAVFGGFMAFNLDAPESWTWIFLIIGGAVMAIGLLGFYIMDDSKVEKSQVGYWRGVVHGFLPSTVKANKPLYFYLGCFILFNIAIQIFMPYLIIYYEVSLGMADYVLIMAPAIILASVVTALWGKVYDKKGFRFSSNIALLWILAGFAVLFIFRDTLMVFIGSLLMMCGYLAGMAVFGAKIRDLTPKGKSGMLQGVRIFSQVLIPGVIGPYIGKAVLANAEMITNNDGTQSFVPNANIFLAAFAVALVLVLILHFLGEKNKPRTVQLKTPFAGTNETWDTYPRPQLKRDSYQSLNGEWDLSVVKKDAVKPLGKINVPFAPESMLSGVMRELKKGEEYLYKRTFTVEEGFNKGRVLMHFGAVDQLARVSVNGILVGKHEGGYLPFSCDITDAIRYGENTVEVEVTDNLDHDYGWGKQCKERGGMWYTPVSGIWQPVWLESVVENAITSLKITASLDHVMIETTGGKADKTLKFGKKEIQYTGDKVVFPVENPIYWTPDTPYLYEFTLTDGNDTVQSYFALRTVSIEEVNGQRYISLNGKPLFLNGLLDQGYYSDGIYLPASPEGYRFDILKMKELGFNMLRKHIKIEPELFYYYCDKFGMIVFQDLVNSGNYSFLRDTALPTVGVKTGVKQKATRRRKRLFEDAARETVELLFNHPCVCYYTIFNEGWGQYDADRLYRELKREYPQYIWDATSGWFAENDSDVQSEHIYFKKIEMTPRADRPLVLSEFGGYSNKIEGHAFNLDKTYGYRFFKETADFADALEKLYCDEIIPAIQKGLNAAVLTQVSDVEDETNGLVTYDRCVVKVDTARMQAMNAQVYRAFEEKIRG